jgi:hypothetical protein
MKARLLSLAAVLAAVVAVPERSQGRTEPVLQLRAFAVNMTGAGRATAGTLDITIERWSTDEERAKLFAVLVERGADKLSDALHDVKPRAGFVRTSTSLGWDLGYAREIPLAGGGRRIIIATDRPIGFAEASRQPRSADYQFLLIEIRLGPDGKGEGKLAAAAKIEYSNEEKTVQVENYGTEPVRLTEVSVVGPKKK